MQTVNIHEAKTHLSKLIANALTGEPFVIAKAGKPLVKVEAIDPGTQLKKRRFGSLQGQFCVPEDFDTMFSQEIEDMFGGLTEAALRPAK